MPPKKDERESTRPGAPTRSYQSKAKQPLIAMTSVIGNPCSRSLLNLDLL